MRKILVVDDTYDKVKKIAGQISDIKDCQMASCLSIRDALCELAKSSFDILIVDLQIPDFTGGEVSRSGGKDLIDRIMIDDNVSKPKYIIGITSHHDSYEENYIFFRQLGWPILVETSEIKKIVETQFLHSPNGIGSVDAAIMTALRSIEFEAVLELPFNWVQLDSADSTIFFLGEYRSRSGEIKKVIAASCSRMGMAASASLAMKICERFSPKYLFMTGIAAGIEGKVNIGDILIADPCWDWGSGKKTVVDGAAKFLMSPHQVGLPNFYRQKFREMSAKREFLDEICNEWIWPGKPDTQLKVHLGPIATGSAVLADKKVLAEIVTQNRDTIGVEMEGYGTLYSASESLSRPDAFVIKSVCDFADLKKDDKWQKYAAYTSASYVKKLLTNSFE